MISDFIIDSLKNTVRNKKNLIFIIILILLFMLLFFDVIFFVNLNSFIDNSISKNIGFRTFTVDKENIAFKDGKKELKNINHVLEVYVPTYSDYYIETDLNINGLDGELALLYGTENITPPSIIGKTIKEVEPGEIICPYNFYPDSNIYNLKIDKNKIIKPNISLNYEFNAFYLKVRLINDELVPDQEKAIKKFKIVGLYDNTMVMNQNNQCYITEQDMKELRLSLNPHINYEETDYTFARVVVDRVENINQVKAEAASLGYNIGSSTMGLDTTMVNTIKQLTIVFFIIIIGFIILVFVLYLKKKIKNEYKNIGILRACGYTKTQVIVQKNIECFIILCISFIISATLFSILLSIASKKLFNFFYYIGFNIENNIFILFLIFVITTIISITISFNLLRKKLNDPIIDFLKD